MSFININLKFKKVGGTSEYVSWPRRFTERNLQNALRFKTHNFYIFMCYSLRLKSVGFLMKKKQTYELESLEQKEQRKKLPKVLNTGSIIKTETTSTYTRS